MVQILNSSFCLCESLPKANGNIEILSRTNGPDLLLHSRVVKGAGSKKNSNQGKKADKDQSLAREKLNTMIVCQMLRKNCSLYQTFCIDINYNCMRGYSFNDSRNNATRFDHIIASSPVRTKMNALNFILFSVCPIHGNKI